MSPCFSKIRTKMNNSETLGAALAALGWTVTKDDFNVYAEKGNDTISFVRYDRQSAFTVSGDTGHLAAIGRKYAEQGVRSWASRNKFSVLDSTEDEMTIVRRSF